MPLKQTNLAMATSIAVALCIGMHGTHVLAPARAQDAPADATNQLSEEELTRQYGRLPQDRFYRHASHLYDQTVRFAQADPDKLSLHDQFLRAYYEGRWDEVRRQLDMLPANLARQIYDKMLKDLNDRYTPILTLDDFFGLANAAPMGLDADAHSPAGFIAEGGCAPSKRPG